jgi:hypothetical protein
VALVCIDGSLLSHLVPAIQETGVSRPQPND